MQFPHWLMVAGACLVVGGSIGLAFRQMLRRLKRNWIKVELAKQRWIIAKSK
jgi:hypothetical protein